MMKMRLKQIDERLFRRFYDQYPKALETEILGSCETLLDVGCGAQSPIQWFSKQLRHTVGVDAFEPSIRESQSAHIHDDYRVIDVLEIGHYFESKSFDAVLASEVVEHLSKRDGLRLIAMMEKIARKKVIVFMPNGFLPQAEYDGNPLQRHRSGWEVDEMRARGFRVVGIHGWKRLRGEKAAIRWRPTPLWRRISYLSQMVVTKRPKYAFHILCVKDLAEAP